MGIIIVPRKSVRTFDVCFHRQKAVIIIQEAVIRKAKSQAEFYKTSQASASSCCSWALLDNGPTYSWSEVPTLWWGAEWGWGDVSQTSEASGGPWLNDDKQPSEPDRPGFIVSSLCLIFSMTLDRLLKLSEPGFFNLLDTYWKDQRDSICKVPTTTSGIL